MTSIIFITLIGFCAAIIQTTGGFGFGSLFVPLVSMIVAYRYATFISIITCMFLQISIIIKYFKKIQWQLIIAPAIISFFTSYLGIHLMVGFSSKTMAVLLGIFLWILAIYLILIAPKVRLKKNIWAELGVGAVSGFTGGMFAVGGPPMVAYYDSVIDDPVTYQATIQTFFFLTSIAMVTEDILCIHLVFKNRHPRPFRNHRLPGWNFCWNENFTTDFNENRSQNRLHRNAARRDIQLGEGNLLN